jgi:TPP-dependent pyruvate/acetoin dehydrogenase alpha subunit
MGRARAGDGPTLLECETYRTRPHAEGMGDYTYRTREEVGRWKARCPIARFRQHLLAAKLADPTELDTIDRELAAQVEEAHRFAETSPWPAAESATQHVYAEVTGGAENRGQGLGIRDQGSEVRDREAENRKQRATASEQETENRSWSPAPSPPPLSAS